MKNRLLKINYIKINFTIFIKYNLKCIHIIRVWDYYDSIYFINTYLVILLTRLIISILYNLPMGILAVNNSLT